MRRSRSNAVLSLLCVLAAAPRAARAQNGGMSEGAAFLLLPVGARATALGQAAAADGGSSEALFWNPAGLAYLRRSELALHHYTAFFGSGDAAVLSLVQPAFGTFTVAAYIVDYGDLDVTLPGGGTIGRVTPRNVALYGSYAAGIGGGIAAGITYKLAQFRIDCSGDCAGVPTASGTTHAVDVGLQWTVPAGRPIVVGAVLRHAGFKLQVNNQAQADPLPTRMQVGVSWAVVRPDPAIEGLDVRVLADLQGVIGQGRLDPVTMLGIESGVRDAVRLRAGYAFLDSEASGPSLGVGLTVGSLVLDLAKIFYAQDALSDQEPLHVSFRWMF